MNNIDEELFNALLEETETKAAENDIIKNADADDIEDPTVPVTPPNSDTIEDKDIFLGVNKQEDKMIDDAADKKETKAEVAKEMANFEFLSTL